jgi:hypothetical protein
VRTRCRIEGLGIFLWVQEEIRLGGQTQTTLMKKLFSLVLIAIVAFVAGCNKADNAGGGAPASTNAPAK